MPLVVSVMGFSRDELAHARRARGRARRGGADRAERVLPERGDRPRDGRRPGRDGARRGARAPAQPTKPLIVKLTPNATRPGRGGARRRGAGRRRGLADQHAARAWRSTRGAAGRGSGAAPAGCPARRCARSPWSRSARSPSACRSPVIGMGGIAIGARRGRFPRRGRQLRGRRHRELSRPRRRPPDARPSSRPRPRPRACALSRRRCHDPIGGNARERFFRKLRDHDGSSRDHPGNRSGQKTCKEAQNAQVSRNRPKAEVEVQLNSPVFCVCGLARPSASVYYRRPCRPPRSRPPNLSGGPRSRALADPANGRSQAGERDPHPARPAEARPQGGPRADPRSAARSARLPAHGQGLRPAARRARSTGA